MATPSCPKPDCKSSAVTFVSSTMVQGVSKKVYTCDDCSETFFIQVGPGPSKYGVNYG